MHANEEEIEEVLTFARAASAAERAYAYLPEIVTSLKAMRDAVRSGEGMDRDRRVKMAGALERLVTEDFAFSESALGQTILKVSNDFASDEPVRREV